jgi:alpha-galactosidase
MKNLLFSIFLMMAFSNLNAQKFNNLAQTPPMGWNSWNKFNCDISEETIRKAADAMVSSGMKDVGYTYIVIDDCWQVGRDSLGFIVADPMKFPSGIKALADYIHAKGLKFGIYSCAGRKTCAERPGSRGYEFQDALSYAKWGVDFLKYDWCNTDGQNAKESYSLMRDAIYAAGRPIVFSVCEWGVNKPWEWAGEVGHLWRTTGDIRNNWDIPDAKEGKVWAGGVIINLDMQQNLENYAGPGHWNDPDMLEVGNGVLTESESRAHFSLWSMLAAPLIAGNDLSNMDAATKNILTNAEVIAIDQDPLGKQGFKILDYGQIEVYLKPLANNEFAVCFFNRLNQNVQSEFNWKTFALQVLQNGKPLHLVKEIERNEYRFSTTFILRDVWQKKVVGNTSQPFKAVVQSHDVVLLRLTTK